MHRRDHWTTTILVPRLPGWLLTVLLPALVVIAMLYYVAHASSPPKRTDIPLVLQVPDAKTSSLWYRADDKVSNTVFVFIHGWDSNNRDAWLYSPPPRAHAKSSPEMVGQEHQYWPNLVLQDRKALGQPDIFLAGYSTDIDSRDYGVRNASEDIWIELNETQGQHPPVMRYRNIIFVTHSAGGIVTRHMLVKHADAFRDKRVGLMLLGSPTNGSPLVRLLNWPARLLENTFVLQLEPGSHFLDELDRDFWDVLNKHLIPNLVGVEALEHHGLFHFKYFPDFLNVVSRQYVGHYFGAPWLVKNTDHETLVKPSTKDAPSHKLLMKFYEDFAKARPATNFSKDIDLVVGLSSEHTEPFEEALKLYEGSMHALYQSHGGSFHISVDKQKYHDAYKTFKTTRHHDIIMMDDPWVPEFAPMLKPLSELDAYHSAFHEKDFENTFIAALRKSCVADGNTVALPLLGNVQLLIYRTDLMNDSVPVPDNHDNLLALLKQYGQETGSTKPIALSYKTENDLTALFWSLLLAFGYEEQFSAAGEVLIPKSMAERALRWMKDVQKTTLKPDERMIWTKLGVEELRKTLLTSKDARMAFGWPGWIARPMIEARPGTPELKVAALGPRPMLGTWVLGIPKSSRQAEEAMQLILTLTRDLEFQTFLGHRGAIPVLKSFPDELRDKPFWRNNWKAIMTALAEPGQRPRTPRWQNIEKDLGAQVRSIILNDSPGASLRDKPGLFQFTEKYPSLMSCIPIKVLKKGEGERTHKPAIGVQRT